MTSTLTTVAPTFEYKTARVKDFQVTSECAVKETKNNRVTLRSVLSMSVSGESGFYPSRRFWTSLQCRFGFSPNIFRYFSHEEVFNRISTRAPDDKIRYCVECPPDGKKKLLAVTNPGSAVIQHDALMELLHNSGTDGASYSGGVVRSTHAPRVGGQPFKILGDNFKNQFIIDTPIDGFGRPNVYLALLRLICSNGLVGYSKTFRTELPVGGKDEDVRFGLIRAMDGFNNEEGFAALRSRFDSAGTSWASVNECNRLYRALASLASRRELKTAGREFVNVADGTTEVVETANPVFHRYHKMTGDLSQIYGLANLDSLSQKRQRTLPSACKVYDLLNFASEVSTHYVNQGGGRGLQAFIGDMVSGEYDLEGTVDQFSDWRDFFIGDEKTAETMAHLAAK